MSNLDKLPHRRYTIKLDIGLDSLDDLATILDGIAYSIVGEGSRSSTSGSPNCGYHLDVFEDPEMTHERYFEAIKAWKESRAT